MIKLKNIFYEEKREGDKKPREDQQLKPTLAKCKIQVIVFYS